MKQLKIVLITFIFSLVVLPACGGGQGGGTLSGTTEGTGLVSRIYFGAVEVASSITLKNPSIILSATGEVAPIVNGSYKLETTYQGLESVTLHIVDEESLNEAVEIPELPADFAGIETNIVIDEDGADVSSTNFFTRDEEEEIKNRLPKPDKKEAEDTKKQIDDLIDSPTSSDSASDSSSNKKKPKPSKDETAKKDEPSEEAKKEVEQDLDEFGIL